MRSVNYGHYGPSDKLTALVEEKVRDEPIHEFVDLPAHLKVRKTGGKSIQNHTWSVKNTKNGRSICVLGQDYVKETKKIRATWYFRFRVNDDGEGVLTKSLCAYEYSGPEIELLRVPVAQVFGSAPYCSIGLLDEVLEVHDQYIKQLQDANDAIKKRLG